MNKLKAIAAVLKFINGRNYGADSLRDTCDYITDEVKTNGGTLIATQGCSRERPVADMMRNKRLHNKTHGKQYEHFVLAPCPNGSDKSPEEVLKVATEIVDTVFPEYMAVIAVHTDTQVVHAHTVLDSVNAVTGRKFSQSPADLNRVKQKANNILDKHGFKIITTSANDIVDHTDHSAEEGFDFLELDESQFITDEALSEISATTTAFPNFYESKDIMDAINLYIEGEKTMKNFKSSAESTQETTAITPTRETLPPDSGSASYGKYGYNISNEYKDQPYSDSFVRQRYNLPNCEYKSETLPPAVESSGIASSYDNTITPPASQSPNTPVPTMNVEATSATAVPTNNYPNTTVSTGPIFRIRGDENSNFARLNELVSQTAAYAQEHQRESANLALAMQQHGQRTGYPSNVAVCSGPIFDIDLTGYGFTPYDDPYKKY